MCLSGCLWVCVCLSLGLCGLLNVCMYGSLAEGVCENEGTLYLACAGDNLRITIILGSKTKKLDTLFYELTL